MVFWLAQTVGIFLLFWAHSASAQSSAGEKSYSRTIKTTYNQISTLLVPMAQDTMDQSLNQKCYNTSKPMGPYSAEFRTRYNCGEIPYGEISQSEKNVFSLKLRKNEVLMRLRSNFTEASKGESPAGIVKMRNPFQLDVLLQRKQNPTYLPVDLLDRKRSTQFMVRSALGDTVTLRHTPRNGALYSMVCGYLPGLKIRSKSKNFDIDASYTWRWFIFSATEQLSVFNSIKDGTLSTRGGKICGVLKTTIIKDRQNHSTPKVELLDVSYPTLYDVKYSGVGLSKTQVRLHTLGLKILNALLTIFRKDNIEKMIKSTLEEAMKEQVDKTIRVHVNDLRNGKIFETILKQLLGENPTENIFAAYKKSLNTSVKAAEVSYQTNLEDNCTDIMQEFLKEKNLLAQQGAIKRMCSQIKVDVSLLPFAPNATYAARGCYSYSYSPLPYSAIGKNMWWQDNCGISSRATVKVPTEYANILNCLENFSSENLLRCAESVAEDLFGIPSEISKILGEADSLSEVSDYAKSIGMTTGEIHKLESDLRKLIRL